MECAIRKDDAYFPFIPKLVVKFLDGGQVGIPNFDMLTVRIYQDYEDFLNYHAAKEKKTSHLKVVPKDEPLSEEMQELIKLRDELKK